jgi:hypothetical protein
MRSDAFERLPVPGVGRRQLTQELRELREGARGRGGGDEAAHRFAASLDHERLPAIAHPTEEIGEGAGGSGGRDP